MRVDLYVGILMFVLFSPHPSTAGSSSGIQAMVWAFAFPWMLDEAQGTISSKEKSDEMPGDLRAL